MRHRRSFRLWLIGLLVVGGTESVAAQLPGEISNTAPVPHQPFLRLKEAAQITGILGAMMLADGDIREDLQERRVPLTNRVARLGNAFGDPRYVVPVLAAGWLVSRVVGQHALERAILHAGEAGVLASGITGLVKFGVGRTRPYHGGDPDRFRPLSGNGAFPSGHTTLAFALATTLARETPDPWSDVGFYSLASLTALSRLNDDRHWASDVVAGALVGYLVGRQVVPGRTDTKRWAAYIMVSPRGLGASVAF